MACASCGNRRKILGQVINGNTPVKAGAKAIAATFRQDARKLGTAVKSGRIGLRVK